MKAITVLIAVEAGRWELYGFDLCYQKSLDQLQCGYLWFAAPLVLVVGAAITLPLVLTFRRRNTRKT